MILLKPDQPRPIDRVIDYFGERLLLTASPPSPRPVEATRIRAA